MEKKDISTEIRLIQYDIEQQRYDLSDREIQLEVFRQIERDANMVGLVYVIDAETSLENWVEGLKNFLSEQLMKGDVRNFLYRVDVSEKKIRQIESLSLQDLCWLIIEREFRKVSIRRHFSR